MSRCCESLSLLNRDQSMCARVRACGRVDALPKTFFVVLGVLV